MPKAMDFDSFFETLNHQVEEEEEDSPTETQNHSSLTVYDEENDQLDIIEGQMLEAERMRRSLSTNETMEKLDQLKQDIDSPKGLQIYKRYLKHVIPLAPIDRSTIEYPTFHRILWSGGTIPPDLLPDWENRLELWESIEMQVGYDPHKKTPAPINSFEDLRLHPQILQNIKGSNYQVPTPIQKSACPAILSGLDLISIAKTGSGKTAAFVWPILSHILVNSHNTGTPQVLVLAPTHELVDQITEEIIDFAKDIIPRIMAISIHGGATKLEQLQKLKRIKPRIVVATPGRLVFLLKEKKNFFRASDVSMLVLDEADLMMDMGFEPQVRGIVSQLRKDRHTLLFSATFPHEIERLCRVVLTNAVRIRTKRSGNDDIVNPNITQEFVSVNTQSEKDTWFLFNIDAILKRGLSLVFCNRKDDCDHLFNELQKFKPNSELVQHMQSHVGDSSDWDVFGVIHGGKSKSARQSTLERFKDGRIRCLIVTDLLARGIDIRTIKTVINYNIPSSITTWIHRVGRTGRADAMDGVAYSIFLPKNSHSAASFCRYFKRLNQPIPKKLYEVALHDENFALEATEQSNAPILVQRSKRART